MKKLATSVLIASLFTTVINAEVIEEFEVRYKTITNGNIELIGNTLMTANKDLFLGDSLKENLNNDTIEMVYIDVDSDNTTNNSSSAQLELKSGSEILFARLYWGARTDRQDQERRGAIKISFKNGKYHELIADKINSTDNEGYYTATTDITEFVKAKGNGLYTVADIFADRGRNTFAGWSLVLAYKNKIEPFRSLTVFDGYAKIPASVDVVVSGFESPVAGNFNTYLGVVAFEGDRARINDFMKMNGKYLSDELTDKNNFFNSRITKFGKSVKSRNPNYSNTLGFDIKLLDVSGKVDNGATSATFTYETKMDWYQPIVLTIANDYNTDLGITQSTDLNGTMRVDDTITVTSTITNAGETPASNLEFQNTIPQGLILIPNSVTVDSALVDAALNQESLSVTIPKTINKGESSVVEFQVGIDKKSPPFGESLELTGSVNYKIAGTDVSATVVSDANLASAGLQPTQIAIVEKQKPVVMKSPEPMVETKPIAIEDEIEKNYAFKAGFLLLYVMPEASTTWNGTEFTTGIDSEATTGYNLRGIYQREIYRVNLEVEMAKWNKASYLELKAAGDYFLSTFKQLQPFVGVGLGSLTFKDDHTKGSSSSVAKELRVGTLYRHSILPKNMEFEAGLNYKMIDVENSEVYSGNIHIVKLKSTLSLGLGVNWEF